MDIPDLDRVSKGEQAMKSQGGMDENVIHELPIDGKPQRCGGEVLGSAK